MGIKVISVPPPVNCNLTKIKAEAEFKGEWQDIKNPPYRSGEYLVKTASGKIKRDKYVADMKYADDSGALIIERRGGFGISDAVAWKALDT